MLCADHDILAREEKGLHKVPHSQVAAGDYLFPASAETQQHSATSSMDGLAE